MKLLVFLLCVAMIVISAVMVASQCKASAAQLHLRRACKVVWTDANEYKIDRCVKRAMAALGTNDQLRDNEIKRLLLSGEKKLESCQKELIECKEK